MRLLPVVLLYFLANLCQKPDKQCKGETGARSNDDGTATYSIYVEGGNATMNTITYQEASGFVTVNNPTLPFSVSVPVAKGDFVLVSYDAIVSFPGTLRIEINFTHAKGLNKTGTRCSA